MMNLILTLIVILIPAYWVILISWEYMVSPGTTWERLIAAFRESATITWARLNGLGAGLAALLAWASPYLGLPQVSDKIQAVVTSPIAVAAYIVLVAIGAEIARRRTLP